MINRDERPRQGCGLPLFAIAAAMTAMAASLAVVRHPATLTRVWVPGLEQMSADGAETARRGFCDKELFQGKGNMFRRFDNQAAKKHLDGAEVAMLRVVLRDFCETHGFALDDQRTLHAARRLIRLFQGGESDCARLRMLMDMQSLS